MRLISRRRTYSITRLSVVVKPLLVCCRVLVTVRLILRSRVSAKIGGRKVVDMADHPGSRSSPRQRAALGARLCVAIAAADSGAEGRREPEAAAAGSSIRAPQRTTRYIGQYSLKGTAQRQKNRVKYRL